MFRTILFFMLLMMVILGCRQVNTSNVNVHRVKSLKALSEGSILGSYGYPNRSDGKRDMESNVDIGRLLFQRYCESCHGLQPVGPILEGRYEANEKSESDISMVMFGFGKMPAFRHKLTRYQIEDILAYLRHCFEQEGYKKGGGEEESDVKAEE